MAERTRPQRPRRQSRDGREGREDPQANRERAEREFLRELETRIQYFVNSGEDQLVLEPMNSYYRRQVHTLAKTFNLESESHGEDRERTVCLLRTKNTAVPTGRSNVKLWDFGSQEFPVNPGEKGVRVALKADGSVELYSEQEKSHIIVDKLVKSKTFRIRKGQILEPDEPGY